MASKELVRPGKNGDSSARLFDRYVQIDSTSSFSIGNIVSFRFPKAGLPKGADGKPIFDRAETAESIRKAMGFASWNSRKQKGASVYEAEWKPVNRFVRVYMWETPDTFSYSVAMYRPAYADSFAAESELIQRSLADAADQPEPAIQSWLKKTAGYAVNEDEAPASVSSWAMRLEPSLLSILIPEACADGCATCPAGSDPACYALAASCSNGQLGNQIGSLGNSITGLGNSVNGATNALNGTNQQLGPANNNWGNSNANWAQTNQQIAAMQSQMSTANANWAQTNQQLQGFNQNWQQTNAILQKAFDPVNGAIFAAATAAGAAVGVMAVEIGCQALSSIGSALYEAITHAKDDAERLEAFTKAREIWEKSSSAASELEKTIDNLLDARRIAKSFGISREQLISQLGTRTIMTQIAKEDALHKAAEAYQQGDQACFASYSNKAAELKDIEAALGRLHDALPSSDDDQAMCNMLVSKLRALRIVEGQLQSARLDILVGQQAFMDQKEAQFKKQAEDIHRLYNPNDHAGYAAQDKKALDDAQTNLDRGNREIAQIVQNETDRCINDLDNGTICERMEHDSLSDISEHKRKAAAERDNPGTSKDRRTQLKLYIDSLIQYEQSFGSWMDSCHEKNHVNVPGQIPIVGQLFRGGAAKRNWCTSYLNGTPKFIDLARQRSDNQASYDSAIQSVDKSSTKAASVKDSLVAHNGTHEKEMNAWRDWFDTVRDEQACLVSDLACDTDTHENALISRYRRLQKKAPQIEQVCRETNL